MAQTIKVRFSLKSLLRELKRLYIVAPEAFSDKSSWNKKRFVFTLILFGILFVGLAILIPREERNEQTFNSQVAEGKVDHTTADGKTESGPGGFGSGYVENRNSTGNAMARSTGLDLKTSASPMILKKPGDLSTDLPPGTKFRVRLESQATLTSSSQPVIGIIVDDVTTDFGLAIVAGARVFGDAVFDQDAERASIHWKSIQFTDGRTKAFEALALGNDLQPGVEGIVHTDSAKNTVGSLMTHFVQGLAEGSITRTQTGQSTGGIENGLLEGTSDTAKERADIYAQGLKKEHAFIEIKKGEINLAILIQSFSYRDAGGEN